MLRMTLFTLLTVLVLVARAWSSRADEPVVLSPAQLWTYQWGVGNWAIVAGDADGDGRADLLAIQDEDGDNEFARTSPLGKPIKPAHARAPYGRAVVAAAFGRFTGARAEELVVVLDDGSVRVASRLDPGPREFRGDDTAVRFAAGEMPRRPARAFAADLDGDGRRDLLVWETASGRLLTLRNAPAADGTELRFTPGSVARKLEGARQLGVGRFGDDRHDSLVWLERDGTLRRAGLKFEADGGAHLGEEAMLCRAKADDHLAVGRFRGEEEADVIVGRRILPAGDPARAVELPALPAEDEARGDLGWMAADIDGNGRDDLVRKRATDDPGTGHDVVVHFASRAGDRLRGFLASDGDGLLDAWKTGAVRPGGLDLRALGCKPGRKDLILEIEWFENVDIDLLRAEASITVNYFATLPVRNRDGSRGIALHAVFRDPTPR